MARPSPAASPQLAAHAFPLVAVASYEITNLVLRLETPVDALMAGR